MTGDPLAAALRRLADFPPDLQLELAAARLGARTGAAPTSLARGGSSPGRRASLDAAAHTPGGAPAPGPLADLPAGSELDPDPSRLDGALLDAIASRALGGAGGAFFTAAPEAGILAAFGLAHAAAARGGPPPGDGVASLLGAAPADPRLAKALDGLAVLDPACGGAALLAAAERLARGQGARLRLLGLDVAPLAARAASLRLQLLGADARVHAADALASLWPDAGLVLSNPPFLRHEALSPGVKDAAARASGLSRQADLSAHLSLLALRRAPVAALVWPSALFTSRSAAPLVAEAQARGGFALRLRSSAADGFAASVDTALVVWRLGGAMDRPAEARVPLAALSGGELALLARGGASPRIRRPRAPPAAAPGGGATTVGAVARVRFGMKSGCNGFFHLRALGGGRYRSALADEVRLGDADVAPLLASLKEARAPEWALPARVLFRPAEPSPAALAYVALGEQLGVHRRPTCAGRSPWWRIAPGRPPAPVLYPAKLGARAFAFLNEPGLCEDKKWIAVFPHAVEPWLLALVLSSTPVRLAIDVGARQLTGAQAIADVDCRVLAAAPCPPPAALDGIRAELSAVRDALARDPVTTDLAAALRRPAQRELDRLVGRALGLDPGDVDRSRSGLERRVADRLAKAAAVRLRIARAG